MLIIPLVFTQERNNLIDKIMMNELIKKDDLPALFTNELLEYENRFINDGFKFTGDLFASVLEGVKNDTIYNVLLVFRMEDPILFKELPKSSFEMIDGTIIEKYMLGRIYIGIKYDSNFNLVEDSCLNIYSKVISPFRIDTLDEKLDLTWLV